MAGEELEELRAKIDRVDDELIAALNRRFELTGRVRELKRAKGLPAKDEAREREIIARQLAAAPAAERDTVFSIYERIFGGARGLIETVARGVCIRNGKVLLCRAKGGKSSYLPGGHIEFGETGAEALVREVKEELGVNSQAGRFLGVIENSFVQKGKKHAEINLVYELTVEGAETPVAQEEWIEFEWCEIKNLDKANLLPESMRPLVRN